MLRNIWLFLIRLYTLLFLKARLLISSLVFDYFNYLFDFYPIFKNVISLKIEELHSFLAFILILNDAIFLIFSGIYSF